ncbi:MAG: GHKL domain-containing protein [Lachnospiraceae bacterium]|nr:GHKL domain-containing protein [Lachnospiraceae bacterium]MDE6251193.1 GHKL domain-containing protein [Lachnospiraceae bacterium]
MELINNIEEVVASAIDGIIIIYLLNKCFVKTKIDKYICSFLFWLAIFVTGDWLEQNFIIQSIVLTSLVGLYCGIILKVEPLKSIIAGVVVNVGLALVNILTIFLVGVLSGSEMTELIDTSGTSRIVVIVLAKITFIFVGIIIVNMISHFVRFKRYQWVYICVYYMATFAICVLVCTLLVSGDFNAVETVIMLIVVMFIVLLNIMTYFLIVRINNENRAEMENKVLNLQIGNQHNMIKKTSELYEETRALRHDMKHYFTTFSEMLKCGDTELVIKEMDKVLNVELNNVQMINLSNPILNAAINDKLNVCHRMGIQTDIKISGSVSEDMSMDMALIISNLMDNAIEAEVKLRNKYIKLAMHEDSESIMLEVRNYINEPVLKEGEELVTHKRDKLRHGYGVKNVKRIIRKYDGYIDIREEEQNFVVTIIVPR